jgi:choline-sulfatase
MENKPNILLIMSDEHDSAVMGCSGDSLVETPHLDSLAAGGIRFENCYCNSPLCAPSRQSFTAGKYISRCGAWGNQSMIEDDDIPSFIRALNAAGYESFLCGKQHYDRDRRYGFIDLIPEANQSLQSGLQKWREPGRFEATQAVHWNKRYKKVQPGEHSIPLDLDRTVTSTARGFLAGRPADSRPFFLMAGYLSPHFPLIAPQNFAQRFKDRVPPPKVSAGLLEKLPRNYQHLRTAFGIVEAPKHEVQTAREMYWALVSWFDQELGRLLTALQQSVHAENTIVIYTSDHGENKGDHGLWWKSCLYDHAARIPLIVNWPARWRGGQRRTEVCSLVDLSRTLAELGGAEVSPGWGWNGSSLLPVLDGISDGWKDMALSEYYGGFVASGITMYRQGPWKYVYHASCGEGYDAQRELYDLSRDPGELENHAGNSACAEIMTELHAEMVAELGEDPETINERCRRETAVAYRGREP